MPDTFLPSREADLVQWANNFNTRVSATPTAFGLTAAQATALSTLFNAFNVAYAVANSPSTRTKPSIQTKKNTKNALVNGPGGIRQLVGIIQKFPGTTNTMRADLGITVPDAGPTPVPVPDLAPEIDMFPPVVRSVRIRLHNEKTLGHRGKPDGVYGALVFSFVGPTPPAAEDTHLWKFEANITKTTHELQFPSSVEPGATVWITAFWYNPRGDSGPSTPAVYTLLPGSLQQAA